MAKGFWKQLARDVAGAAMESTEVGQAVGTIKKEYDAHKNPPPPPPPTVLTPAQERAVAGAAAASRLRGTGTAPAPTPPPTPTPIARPPLKVSAPKGVRPTITVTPPKILTPLQQQAVAAASKQNPKRPNLLAQPSTRPSWDPDNDPDWQPEDVSAPASLAPVAKSRTQKRPSKRGLAPQAKAAFASLHEHFDNQ